MFTRPADLPDAVVADAVTNGWNLAVSDIEYAAVGFGSHHWHATGEGERWFVTVDDLDTRRRDGQETRADAAARLGAALTAAHALRSAGLDFVIAPVPALTGDVVSRLDDRFAIAVYEHIDGTTYPWGHYDSTADRHAVVDRLVAIQAASGGAESVALVDDFEIPKRDHLRGVLADDGLEWGPGPFAGEAERLLRRHAAEVVQVLGRYDDLVRDVASRPERFVITHGEPHRANTIDTADGVVLIDWDTALVAPPERDLWMLIGEDPSIADDYTARAGIEVEPAAVELYRLWWDLCEISLYVADFRAPHADTEDTRTAWNGLREHLDPTRWRLSRGDDPAGRPRFDLRRDG